MASPERISGIDLLARCDPLEIAEAVLHGIDDYRRSRMPLGPPTASDPAWGEWRRQVLVRECQDAAVLELLLDSMDALERAGRVGPVENLVGFLREIWGIRGVLPVGLQARRAWCACNARQDDVLPARWRRVGMVDRG